LHARAFQRIFMFVEIFITLCAYVWRHQRCCCCRSLLKRDGYQSSQWVKSPKSSL